MFLNRLASDQFRNSIQGVFTMAIGGTARVIGGVAAGAVAATFGLTAVLYWGASLAGCSLLIIAFLFSRIPPKDERENPEFEVSPEEAS